MPKTINCIMLALFFLAFTGMATASTLVGTTADLTSANGWSGTQAHQDKSINVNWLVDFNNNKIDLSSTLPYSLIFIDKYESDEDEEDWEWVNDGSGFTVAFDYPTSGTWSAPSDWTAPLYFSVKAGSAKCDAGFALYYIEDGALSGTWDTSELQDKDLSHISFWKVDENNPVPVPATILLFGTGLAALSGIARKKHNA